MVQARMQQFREKLVEESVLFVSIVSDLQRGVLPRGEVLRTLEMLRVELAHLSAEVMPLVGKLGLHVRASISAVEDLEQALKQVAEAMEAGESLVKRILSVTTQDPDVQVLLSAEQQRARTLLVEVTHGTADLDAILSGQHPYCALLDAVARCGILNFRERTSVRRGLENNIGIELAEAALDGYLSLPSERGVENSVSESSIAPKERGVPKEAEQGPLAQTKSVSGPDETASHVEALDPVATAGEHDQSRQSAAGVHPDQDDRSAGDTAVWQLAGEAVDATSSPTQAPVDAASRLERATAAAARGLYLAYVGQWTDAAEEFCTSATLHQQLAGETGWPWLTSELGKILNNYGVALERLGRNENASSAYAEAVAEYRRSTTVPGVQKPTWLAQALTNYGIVLNRLQRPTDAAAACGEAIALLRAQLTAERIQSSVSSPVMERLSKALFSQAIAFERLGRVQEAGSAFAAACTIYEHLVQHFGRADLSGPLARAREHMLTLADRDPPLSNDNDPDLSLELLTDRDQAPEGANARGDISAEV